MSHIAPGNSLSQNSKNTFVKENVNIGGDTGCWSSNFFYDNFYSCCLQYFLTLIIFTVVDTSISNLMSIGFWWC